MAKNRVIGNDGNLPWKCKEDMEFFKEHTTTHYVLMGRKTADSIKNGQLPNRTNYVVSSSHIKEEITLPWRTNVISVQSGIDHYLRSCKTYSSWPILDLWVIGGASIYEQTLPIANELYLNVLEDEYDGDTYFPEITRECDVEITSYDHNKFKTYHYIFK